MKCPLCKKEIAEGDDGVMVCLGYWKRVSEEAEFEPAFDEFDACAECAKKVHEFVLSLEVKP